MNANKSNELAALADEVRRCRLCESELPLGPRPVIQVGQNARILIAGQAPGTRVHETGLPFNDPSGDRLRDWMGVSRELFYDPDVMAIVPMGFCYPGRGKSGDLPPIPRCAETWRDRLLSQLPQLQLTLAIGQYAQAWHLNEREKTLTATVMKWRSYGESIMPMPHPSPRNNIWLWKNPWFESELIPILQARVQTVLSS